MPVSLTRKPAPTSSSSLAAPVSTSAGPIVATVNGEPITQAEWQARLQLIAGKSALDNLVREKILRQEARKKGVVLTPKDVAAKAIEEEKGFRDRAGSPARFDDFLKQNGLSLASFRGAMRYRAEMETLQQKLATKLGETIKIPDKELQDTYEKQKFQYVQPAEVKVAQIMLNFTGLDDAAKEKTKVEATKLLERAKAPGANFAALAKEASQDPDTKDKGGELPWMSYSPWGPPFDQVVMAAPVGLIGEPVRSYKGYHIVKVLDKHPQRTRTFDEVKEELRKRLTDQRQAQAYREYLRKAESAAKTDVKLKF
jgi:foldase protein PrsA